MNKALLTIGIILSLGSMGCAGFGLQQSSNLSAQFRQEQGIDPLWTAETPPSQGGLETPRYADQDLGDLWNPGESEPSQEKSSNLYAKRGLDELWN